jgi:predicted  nucleic acid-binding Zn-ribbon protein
MTTPYIVEMAGIIVDRGGLVLAEQHPGETGSRKGQRRMESLTSGTTAGAGSFRCSHCGYLLTLAGSDALSDCPACGGGDFQRASLFSTPRMVRSRRREAGADTMKTGALGGASPQAGAPDSEAWLQDARERLGEPGEYLVYEESGAVKTVALTREWTRIGRSLAADVRFDDPTVSRRHALVVRQADGVHVLDDRSLNGVFVNGGRIDRSGVGQQALRDGDEIVVGRYRLRFVMVAPQQAGGTATTTLQSAG